MSEPAPTPTVAQLVSQLSEQSSRLARAEIALVKAEMTQKAKDSGLGIGLIAGALFVLFHASMLLLWAAVFGLAEAWPLWLSALVIGVAGLLVAVGLIIAAMYLFKRVGKKGQVGTLLRLDKAAVAEARAAAKQTVKSTPAEDLL